MRKLYVLICLICSMMANANGQKQDLQVRTDSLFELGMNYYHQGNFDEARRLVSECGKLQRMALGKRHPDYGNTLSTLGEIKLASGDESGFDDIIRYCGIIEANYNIDSDEHRAAVDKMIGSCLYMKRYDDAVKIADYNLRKIKDYYGATHQEYLAFLKKVELMCSILKRYPEAIMYASEIKQIMEKSGDIRSKEYLDLVLQLAGYYNNIGKYQEAIRLDRIGLRLMEKLTGKDNPEYALCLAWIANNYSGIGDEEEAFSYQMQAVRLYEKICGKDHKDYAIALSGLANSEIGLGKASEAYDHVADALRILESTVGKESEEYVSALINMALCEIELDNVQKALELYTEAAEICGKVSGEESLEYANAIGGVARCKYKTGNGKDALDIALRKLDIYKKLYGEESPLYGAALSNVALYYDHLKNYAEAVRLGNQAMEITRRTIGENNVSYANMLINQSFFSCQYGRLDEAISFDKKAMKILENLYGKDHPDYISAEFFLGELYFYGKDPVNLEKYSREAADILAKRIRKSFASLTAGQRRDFWEANSYLHQEFLPYYSFNFPTPKLISNGYDGTLFAKGILLGSERDFSKLVLESGDKELIETFNNLQLARRLLSRLHEKPIAQRESNTDSLENAVDRYERILLARVKEYGDYTRNMNIRWPDVKKRLGKDDVALEFAAFPLGKDSLMYAAYVLDSRMKRPQMVLLFNNRDLGRLRNSDIYSTDSLSRMLWGKLDKYIAGKQKIYFAPAGVLYNIAIESIPDYKRDGLISDWHRLFRLSSTRELAVSKSRGSLKDAALYGGMKYDTDSKLLETDAARYPEAMTRDFDIASIADSLQLRAGVKDLPATREEIEQIDLTMRGGSVKPQMYMGLEGTEGSFKALSGKNVNLIHIATHGFYWPEEKVKRMKDIGFLQDAVSGTSYEEDKALTRSGLLFSGANLALSGKPLPDNAPDGILTAKEISMLDLHGLDMVVLSACQTGLGEIKGDGVFGLQRGFKKAGANTLMMSLWKVDDRATQMLMTKFYEHYLSGTSKQESLLLAQKSVREYEDPATHKRPFSHYRFWAAFILLDPL